MTIRRLSPSELLAHGQTMLGQRNAGRPMLVSLRLNRSDDLQALSGETSATQVLDQVKDRIEQQMKGSDDRYAIASIDEIWVLLGGLANRDAAEAAVRALRLSLLPPVTLSPPVAVYFVPTIGGAFGASPSVGIGGLLQVARESLAAAAHHDDRIAVREAGPDDSTARRIQMEQALRRALYSNELQVHYQPQIDLRTAECRSAEALIRWPERGDAEGSHPVQLAPEMIASICNDAGMIGHLTQFVLNSVLRQQAEWRRRGLSIQVAINMTARSAASPELAAQVEQSCQSWGVPPEAIAFEFSEDSLMQRDEGTLACMRALRALGCSLAIDDFGNGYASFAWLRQFPVQELKIDRCFIQNLQSDPGDQQIVPALIQLAHAFGMRALAMGVDNSVAEQMLRDFGCDRAQGFHFAHAMSASEFEAFVTKRLESPATA